MLGRWHWWQPNLGGLPVSPHKNRDWEARAEGHANVYGTAGRPRNAESPQVRAGWDRPLGATRPVCSWQFVPREVKGSRVAKHRCAPSSWPAGARLLAANFLAVCLTFELTCFVGRGTPGMTQQDCDARSSRFHVRDAPLTQNGDRRSAGRFGAVLAPSCFLPLPFRTLSFCVHESQRLLLGHSPGTEGGKEAGRWGGRWDRPWHKGGDQLPKHSLV